MVPLELYIKIYYLRANMPQAKTTVLVLQQLIGGFLPQLGTTVLPDCRDLALIS